MKRSVQYLLPKTVQTQVTYTGRKLRTCFQVKDKCKYVHQHDLVYHVMKGAPSELLVKG